MCWLCPVCMTLLTVYTSLDVLKLCFLHQIIHQKPTRDSTVRFKCTTVNLALSLQQCGGVSRCLHFPFIFNGWLWHRTRLATFTTSQKAGTLGGWTTALNGIFKINLIFHLWEKFSPWWHLILSAIFHAAWISPLLLTLLVIHKSHLKLVIFSIRLNRRH